MKAARLAVGFRRPGAEGHVLPGAPRSAPPFRLDQDRPTCRPSLRYCDLARVRQRDSPHAARRLHEDSLQGPNSGAGHRRGRHPRSGRPEGTQLGRPCQPASAGTEGPGPGAAPLDHRDHRTAEEGRGEEATGCPTLPPAPAPAPEGAREASARRGRRWGGSAGPPAPLLLGLLRSPKPPPPVTPASPVPTLPCAPGSRPCWNETPKSEGRGSPVPRATAPPLGGCRERTGRCGGCGGGGESQPRGKGRGGPRAEPGTRGSPNPNILKEVTGARRREGSRAGLALGGGSARLGAAPLLPAPYKRFP